MRASRGVPAGAMEWAGQFVAAAKSAGRLKDHELPEAWNGERPDPAVDNIAVLLGIVAGQRADEQEIARNYLAPREQLLALASWCIKRGDKSTPAPTLPILSGWRREILGGELLDLLDGKLAIGIDPQTNAVHVLPRASV
jgi:ribonuclease D